MILYFLSFQVVIQAGIYLILREDISIVNPKEIDPNHPEKQKLVDKWVSTMFSFLFGDGVCAFILKKADDSKDSIKIGKITHAVNF